MSVTSCQSKCANSKWSVQHSLFIDYIGCRAAAVASYSTLIICVTHETYYGRSSHKTNEIHFFLTYMESDTSQTRNIKSKHTSTSCLFAEHSVKGGTAQTEHYM